jgi:hypothetical protein
MRQNQRDDSWDIVHVDVEAETAEEAIRSSAMTRSDRAVAGGEVQGRWCAFPAEHGVTYLVRIRRIAEIDIANEGPWA